MTGPAPRPDPVPALRRLYGEVDAAVRADGRDCAACGRCCRFDEADHVLYASRLERIYLEETSGPPPTVGEAEPGETPERLSELLAAGLRCPFQSRGRCLAREGRTLGCRLHFCSGGDGEQSEYWHRRLKRLHRELDLEWDYAPLLPLVRPPGRPNRSRQ